MYKTVRTTTIRASTLLPLIKILQIDLFNPPTFPDIIGNVGLNIKDAYSPDWLLIGFADLQTFAKCPLLPHLLQSTSQAGHFVLGWQCFPQK